MSENAEFEDLDQLVKSAGWQRYCDMVTERWGPSSEWFLGELDKALSSDNAHSADHFRQIRASQREVMKVLKLVPERLHQLQGAPQSTQEYIGSRRGGL